MTLRTTLFSLLGLTLIGCADAFPTDGSLSADEGGIILVSGSDGPDEDGDGYGTMTDCDDYDANVNPGEEETLGNDVDDDCDGDTDCDDSQVEMTDYGFDADGDGWFYSADGISVTVVKMCSDDDANAALISELTGGTGDLSDFGEIEYVPVDESNPLLGYELPDLDCDDGNANTYPAAVEYCDGMDNDCDGSVDDGATMMTVYEDWDADTFGNVDVSQEACDVSEGWVADSTDCDDADAAINPAATEVCDGAEVDEDCNAMTADPTSTFYQDWDMDSQGNVSVTWDACSAPEGYVANSNDCDDLDAAIHLGADETCADDGTDNDCDGSATETPIDEITRYRDFDSDMYGDSSVSYTSCVAPSGYVAAGADCDDTDATANPGATEIFDGVDNDCDGTVDNSVSCSFEIQILEDAGTATSLTGIVSDNPSLTGSYLSGGTTGVTVTPTSLGGDVWEYLVMMDLCMSTTGSVIIDGEFMSGESLADDSIANVFAYMDSTELNVGLYDNGDGSFSYEITR